MVYRGKISKACERCRSRRLKCDLTPGTCGQCIRANSTCSGYRNTETIRFQHDTTAVINKVMRVANSGPRYLPLPIDTQACDAFLHHYVSSECWAFLKPFYQEAGSQNSVTLAFEATSLAFLWHNVNSETALFASRQRYALALRMVKNMLKSHNEAIKDSMLLTTLLFDVYEKITTDVQSRGTDSAAAHMDGALALVKLRGLQHFQKPSQLQILKRLNSQCLSQFIATDVKSYDTLTALRDHLNGLQNSPDVLANLANAITDAMITYGKSRRDFKDGSISKAEFIHLAISLDEEFQNLEQNMPPAAMPTTRFLKYKSEHAFHMYYHIYTHHNVCTSRNMIRVARIDLNESLLDYYTSLPPIPENTYLVTRARSTIAHLVHEILASLPNFIDCQVAAHSRIPSSTYTWPQILPESSIDLPKQPNGHPHTPRHQTDCYILLFPLYAAGRANVGGTEVREWVVKQLRYMAGHFNLRNAEVVAKALEGGEVRDAWDYYVMLGCYAFNA